MNYDLKRAKSKLKLYYRLKILSNCIQEQDRKSRLIEYIEEKLYEELQNITFQGNELEHSYFRQLLKVTCFE
jgi:hypothetical protein